MLKGRAFGYSPYQEHKTDNYSKLEKQNTTNHTSTKRGFGWRPHSYGKDVPGAVRIPVEKPRRISVQEDKEEAIAVAEHDIATTTKPVPVPGKQRSVATRSHKHRHAGSTPTTPNSETRRSSKHDPNAMSPSMAALLAMTSIPRKKSFAQSPKTRPLPRSYSSQQLMEDWKRAEVKQMSSYGSSPQLDLLLSPSDKEESPMFSRKDSTISTSSSEESVDRTSPSSTRSPSSESVPSLWADDLSTISSSIDVSPGEGLRRSSRGRSIVVTRSLESDFDHPLSPALDVPDIGSSEDSTPRNTETSGLGGALTPRQPLHRQRSSFKSNLTASLTALKSSFRTISNFASTPYTMPDDHLTRGLFADSQQIHREMRPRPLQGLPSPELRRYLNPSAYQPTPHSDFHHHGRFIEHFDYESPHMLPSAADAPDEQLIIALQDRAVITSSSNELPITSGAADEPVQTEAGRAMHEPHPQYRRELRENSEWLRVCVLETNMRRAGKIDGPGHARIWLPARQVRRPVTQSNEGDSARQTIPRRWVAVYPE